MKDGDYIYVERIDGYTTIGVFSYEDDRYVVVMGQVGDDIGRTILIPRDNIATIRLEWKE